VYFQINLLFYFHWICTVRLDTAFDIWQKPALFGWPPVALFQAVNILLGIFIVIVFLLHLRAPRKQHITNRIACLFSLGLLVLLHTFHTCCREFPRDYFKSQSGMSFIFPDSDEREIIFRQSDLKSEYYFSLIIPKEEFELSQKKIEKDVIAAGGEFVSIQSSGRHLTPSFSV